jgi:hypothetical protein
MVEEDNKEESDKPDWTNFSIGLLINIVIIIVIMIFGSTFLYFIKVGASNVLPTEITPNNITSSNSKKIDLNILRQYSFFGLNIFNTIEVKSQKAIFNSVDGTFNKITSWFGDSFYGHIIDSMLQYNNMFINAIGSTLNLANDSILILFSFILFPIILIILSVFNGFYLFVDQFIELANYLNTNYYIPKIIGYLIELILCIPLIIIFSIIASILSIFTVIGSALIIPFGYTTYNIQGDTNKNNSFTTFFKDTFKYKTIFMLILFIMAFISNVQGFLGATYTLLLTIIIGIFIYFFGMLQQQFNLDDNSQTSGLASTLQSFFVGGKKKSFKLT